MYADNPYSMLDIHQQEQHDDDVNTNHIKICPTVNCQICQQPFPLNNALHQHLRSTCQAPKQFKDPKKAKLVTVMYAKPKKEVIITSTAPRTNGSPGYGFCKWQYITANIQFNKDLQSQVHIVCLDTGCTMTLINRDFLKEVTLNAIIKKMASIVSVRGIRPREHSLVDYATINLYFPRNECCTTAIHQEVHIVNGFKTKMLINMDILG